MNTGVEKAKVVIADDSPLYHKLVKDILESESYNVAVAANGREALILVQEHKPAVLITDWEMPDISGKDVCAELQRRQDCSTHIIFLTSNTGTQNVITALRGGASDYLTKPFHDGELLARVAVGVRIAELRREIQEQKKFLRALIDNVPDYMYVKGTSSKFLLANKHLAHSVGANDPDSLIGKSDFDFYPASLASQFYEDEQNIIKSGRPLYNREEEAVENGEQAFLLTTKVPLFDDQGCVIGVAGVGRNITDRRRVELQRQHMEIELRHAHKMESIGQLAAGIAHEINTPAQYIGDNVRFVDEMFPQFQNVLHQFCELLGAAQDVPSLTEKVRTVRTAFEQAEINYLTEEIPKALAQAREGVERVSTLVKVMKDFSHPGTQEKHPCDLHKAIESTALVSRNEWKHVAEMEFKFDPSLPLIPCLIGEFNQVILNLIVTAAHSISDVIQAGRATKGRITIETRKCADWAEIRVQDPGTGIPEKIRSRVFDPFFTTKDIGKGTGQGLAITRTVVVDKHNGTIDFETELDKGTTFIVRIPYCDSILSRRKLIRAGAAHSGLPFNAETQRLVF